jgi:hypothetical protein
MLACLLEIMSNFKVQSEISFLRVEGVTPLEIYYQLVEKYRVYAVTDTGVDMVECYQ